MAQAIFRAFYNLSTGYGYELGISDGSYGGTQLLSNFNPYSGLGTFSYSQEPYFTEINGNVFFRGHYDNVSGIGLGVTDGTTAGTTLLSTAIPDNFVTHNGLLFFEGKDGGAGTEPWVSDGTVAGTFRLADINPSTTGSSSPFFGSNVKSATDLYFDVYDGTSSFVWKTDGTAAGTMQVGTGGLGGDPVLLGDQIIGQEYTPATGGELFSMNINTGARTLIDLNPGVGSSSPQGFVVIDGKVIFNARGPASSLQNELWITDGTAAGTSLLKDINPTGTGFPDLAGGHFLGDNYFFAANDGVNGIELWTTDGTTAGTQLVKDLALGSGSSYVKDFVQVGNELFFTARDETSQNWLWKTDGTTGGTEKIVVLGSVSGSSVSYAETVDGRLFVDTGFQIFATDGTVAGTHSIFASSEGMTAYGNGVLFAEQVSSFVGDELYYYDGSGVGPYGTSPYLVRNIRTDSFGASSPDRIIVIGDERFTGFDNTVTLDDSGEIVDALSGNDVITGGTGNDEISGNSGNDILDGAAGNDTLDGGLGNDTASFANSPGPVTVVLAQGVDGSAIGDGTDILRSIENVDGSMHADSITGNGTDNRLFGGAGNDMLIGGLGYDRLIGGEGDDTLDGGDDYDVADYSGASSSVIIYIDNPAFTSGGGGSDTILNVEEILGSEFNDRLIGDANDNNLYGGAGDDVLKGKGGNNYLDGGDGNDKLIGGDGDDDLEGGDGNDTLIALKGLDSLYGGSGDDLLFGGRDDDYLSGSDGADNLRGNLGNDEAYGGDGNDDVRGGGGNDMLYGGYNDDFLMGENGADRLDGGQGDDTLNGVFGTETAVDTFVYQDDSYGFDRVRGFEDNQDKIDLTDFGYTDFATDVQPLATAANGGLDTKINFGSGNVLYIEDLALADFDSADVLL